MKEVKSTADRIKWIADKNVEINNLQNESDIIYKRITSGDYILSIGEFKTTTVTHKIMSDIYQNVNDKIQAITDEVAKYLKEETE